MAEPAWWATARRLYKLRFMRPSGRRLCYFRCHTWVDPDGRVRKRRYYGDPVRLTMRDIARILDQPLHKIRYAVDPTWRQKLIDHSRKRYRGEIAPDEALPKCWVSRWRQEYRRERGFVPTRVEPFRLER